MGLNSERKLTLIYLILGLVMAYLSTNFSVGIAVLLSLIVYAVSLPLAMRYVKEQKKLIWYVMNTAVTYILVWLVLWILLFNMG